MSNKSIAIEVKNLSITYKSLKAYSIKKNLLKLKKVDVKKFKAVNNVSFEVEEGKILGIIGKNGSGKSTLIKMILGQDTNFQGELKLGTSIKIGYISQNIIFENNEKTVLDYFLEGNNLSETEARSKLAKYGFRQENAFKRIGKLSGGEKVRIILMKLIQKILIF